MHNAQLAAPTTAGNNCELCIVNCELLKACEQTLIQKGDLSTGWSTGWRINLWARLHKADQAYHIYRKLLTFISPKGGTNYHSGGTYPNLMDAHPPFQIDGNFGGTAGVCEMLVQSQYNIQRSTFDIHLLPALPTEWADGEVSGLCARGGYELDFTWRNGKVVTLSVKAKQSGKVTIVFNGESRQLKLKAGETWRL